MTKSASTQTLKFKTELTQLLDIIVHSLYSKKEIFLRELISNSCDAIDKLRFESLQDDSLLEGDSEWKIQLIADKEHGTLTVRDNGMGMSRESIVQDLGTIARSGTQAFLEQLREASDQERPELIGQFGVGFYSSFMVAGKVRVVSKKAGESTAVQWQSDGKGKFTVSDAEKEGRGTDVILHLNEDEKEFLEPHRLRSVVKHYSDFVEHPIVMDVEKPAPGEEEKEEDEKTTIVEEEVLNSRKALWLRSSSDVEQEDYDEFYRQISHDFHAPAHTIHFAAEGTNEFRALLFLPEKKPFDFHWKEVRTGLQLYIQRVFIMDDCEDLLPAWLRFVQGVVDSSDLPLNVSREMLQKNKVLEGIRKGLVSKILRTLEEMKKDNLEAYTTFFQEFGPILKEGLSQDWAHKDQLAELMLFESTQTQPGEFISLEDYVGRMPDDQQEIYYLIGEKRSQIEHSPYLEALRAKGHEVLLLTDVVDEFVVAALHEYKEKKLKAVDKGELEDSGEEKSPEAGKFEGLFGFLEENLGNIKKVRLSRRLQESASCLVAEESAMGAHMERIMAKMGRGDEVPESQRILELNGEHPTVKVLLDLHGKDPADPRVADFGRLLHDQAVIAEGSSLEDPAAHARRINTLIEAAVQAK